MSYGFSEKKYSEKQYSEKQNSEKKYSERQNCSQYGGSHNSQYMATSLYSTSSSLDDQIEEDDAWDIIFSEGKLLDSNEIEIDTDSKLSMNHICQCGNIFSSNLNFLFCTNSNCGIVRYIDGVADDGLKHESSNSQITMVGQNSSLYRNEIYKSGSFSADNFKLRINSTYDELKELRNEHKKKPDQNNIYVDITKNHLKDTAKYYSILTSPSLDDSISNETYGLTDVDDIIRYSKYAENIKNIIYKKDKRSKVILRSTNKRVTLASLLSLVLLADNQTCSKTDISSMFNLKQDGFAAGEKILRSLLNTKNVTDINLNISRINPEIDSLLHKIKIYFNVTEKLEDEYINLKKSIIAIYDVLVTNNIAHTSNLTSRINGIVYVVCNRCKNRNLIPNPPNIVQFCTINKIRKPTIEQVVNDMNNFHRFFNHVYLKFDLDNTKW
jgi:hypothetical protein